MKVNKILQFFAILTIIGLSQSQITKKCQVQINSIQEKANALFDSFERQQYEETVADALILQHYLSFFLEDCPAIYEKLQKSEFQAPLDCQKNIHILKELVNGDIVSNFQQIRNINDFLSTTCLPKDYSPNGFKDLIDEHINVNLQGSSKGNKMKCTLCNTLVSSLNLYVKANNPNLYSLLELRGLCKLLPGGLIEGYCIAELGKYAPGLIAGIKAGEDSDTICRTRFQYCVGWEQCNLHGVSKQPNWQPPSPSDKPYQNDDDEEYQRIKKIHPLAQSFIAPWIWHYIDKLTKYHLPLKDWDGDRFSTKQSLRGYNWRGYDCHAWNDGIYPGRKYHLFKLKGSDYNCNGISGTDYTTGVPFKDKYCYKSHQIGSVTIGDSAGAHFELPPQYLNGSTWDNTTFEFLQHNLENEFDKPQGAPGTGYRDYVKGKSFYLKLLQRNRCNRNDYQNLGVNGASSRDSMDNMLAIARNQKKDHPVLVFWELVGNDVCGKTPYDMTSPQDFKKNIIKLWKKLDTVLPRGSHMVVTGVADGRVLYDCLQNRTHPIGVKYPQMYDFLNCMGVTPCSGWMNSNATIRDQTTARAQELNEMYKEIIIHNRFRNFDIQYYDLPFQEIFETIEKNGGQCWDGIEPSDGFHPSELSDQIWAEILWKKLELDHGNWLGPINPHNQEIIKYFGGESIYTGQHKDDDEEELIELQ